MRGLFYGMIVGFRIGNFSVRKINIELSFVMVENGSVIRSGILDKWMIVFFRG